MTIQELLIMANKKHPDTVPLNANQMIANTVKMRGLGLDDPIEWDAFGTTTGSRPEVNTGYLSKLFGPQIAQAMTSPGDEKKKEGMISKMITELLGLGMTSGVQVPANWRQR